ncbi:MAG: hypothetical protein SGPRY_007113 [Prymnesium sp.]
MNSLRCLEGATSFLRCLGLPRSAEPSWPTEETFLRAELTRLQRERDLLLSENARLQASLRTSLRHERPCEAEGLPLSSTGPACRACRPVIVPKLRLPGMDPSKPRVTIGNPSSHAAIDAALARTRLARAESPALLHQNANEPARETASMPAQAVAARHEDGIGSSSVSRWAPAAEQSHLKATSCAETGAAQPGASLSCSVTIMGYIRLKPFYSKSRSSCFSYAG